ncbi:Primosomal protein N' [Candidatus Hepatincolaceae symbiont of Richtersius coronifer]
MANLIKTTLDDVQPKTLYKFGDIVAIYIPLKLDTSYSYLVPEGLQLQKGDVVLVPLRNQEVYGIVYDIQDIINFDKAKLKEVIQKVENIPALTAETIDFLQFIAGYNLANFGAVLKMAISIAGFDFNHYEEILRLNFPLINQLKLTEPRKKIIALLEQTKSLEKKALIAKAQVSYAVVNSLIKKGFLLVSNHNKRSFSQEDFNYTPLKLYDEQMEAVDKLIVLFNPLQFMVAVLQGVPGSGKTEVYFEVVNKILQEGKQILIMLPEIALSTQIVERFKERFGIEPYIWHSDTSQKDKKKTWIAASTGELKVIIGARSALFMPFKNLGLIIVDEEHDSSYKQEEGVIYNARDMAIIRAKIHKIPIILSSATPSIETLNNVEKKGYHLINLYNRSNQMVMPNINIIDMKLEDLKKGDFLSPTLVKAMQQTLQKGEQVLLFVNKRGYASCVLCKSCGEKYLCKNCSVNLVEHKNKKTLVCHHCGYIMNFINKCKSCSEENVLISLGMGIEKIFEEVSKKFSDKNVVMLSSDTMSSQKKAQEIINNIHALKYNILIGTQIISKGYNFAKLTLVGIIDGDFMYSLDLKANEKAWQMLYQVSGRSGRDVTEGKVFLQSYTPNNSLLQSLAMLDYKLFVEKEKELRKRLGFPPFGKLVGIIVSSKNQEFLEEYCQYIVSLQPSLEGVEILGPTPAPIYLLRNFYRKRFLVKAALGINLQKFVKSWLLRHKAPSNIKLQIDVDPISFY